MYVVTTGVRDAKRVYTYRVFKHKVDAIEFLKQEHGTSVRTCDTMQVHKLQKVYERRIK